MRIAMVTTDRKPGGIIKAYLNYLEILHELGHELTLVMPDTATDLQKGVASFLSDRVTLHLLSRVDLFFLRRFGMLRPALKTILRNHDAIISHNNFLCRALGQAGPPIVAVCHSDKPTGLCHADQVIVLSRAAVDIFTGAGFDRTKVSIIPHYYDPLTTSNQYEEKPLVPFTVTAAGRFVGKKGFEDFIEAAAHVHKTHPDIRFILAGSGEEEVRLKTYAATCKSPVEFPGWMNIESVAAQAHIFCLTSRRETFGYVLCEMMDRGLPCISTYTNGPIDILGDGQAGLLYPAGEPQALAAHICALYNSPQQRQALSSQAYARIRSADFSRSLFADRVQTVLSTLRPIH